MGVQGTSNTSWPSIFFFFSVFLDLEGTDTDHKSTRSPARFSPVLRHHNKFSQHLPSVFTILLEKTKESYSKCEGSTLVKRQCYHKRSWYTPYCSYFMNHSATHVCHILAAINNSQSSRSLVLRRFTLGYFCYIISTTLLLPIFLLTERKVKNLSSLVRTQFQEPLSHSLPGRNYNEHWATRRLSFSPVPRISSHQMPNIYFSSNVTLFFNWVVLRQGL